MSEKKDAKDAEGLKPVSPDLPVTATGQIISSEVTRDYEKLLYTPERQAKLQKGELSLRDYHAISGPEMLQMALIGFRMYENGKYSEAETVFNGLIALEPREAYYYTALGAVYLAQEQFERAKHNFDMAVTFNPKELAAFVNRGEVHLRLGNIMEAAQDFKAAVDLDPSGKDPLTIRARVLAAAALELLEGGGEPEKKPAAKKAEPARKAEPAKKSEPSRKAPEPARKAPPAKKK